MQAKAVINAGGPVQIGPLTFIVRELPIAGEIGLRARFRALARDSFGPGSFMANVLPVTRWLREQGEHQDAAALVAATAPLVAAKAGASDDYTDLYRQTPDGVAWEVFYRTRETHPESTRDEIRAVVTEANCLAAHLQMMEALDPKSKGSDRTPSTSPSGS